MSKKDLSSRITSAPARASGITDTSPKGQRGIPPEEKGRIWPFFPVFLMVIVMCFAVVVASSWDAIFPGPSRDAKVGKDRGEPPAMHPWTAGLAELVERGLLRGDRLAWNPGPWQPATPDDHVMDRYLRLLKASDQAVFDLLGGTPLVEGATVGEEDFTPRAVDTFLREKGLTVTGIWRGEPDDAGRQRPTPGRYTLQTRGTLSTPKVVVRERDGKEAPTSMNSTNPELVVEIKGGKVFGVRTFPAR